MESPTIERSATPALAARASGSRALDHRRERGVNVGRSERTVSTIAGASLIAYAAARRGWSGRAASVAGVLLIARGATGRCAVYRRLGRNSAEGVAIPRDVELTRAITIAASRDEIAQALRGGEWMQAVLPFVQEVRREGDLLHLQVRLPRGHVLDAKTRMQASDASLVWRSEPGDAIEHELRIALEPAPGALGTELRASLRVRPPGGIAGAALAQALRQLGARGLGRALQRFKQRIEAGEIATTAEQPVGRRTALRAMVAASREAIAR